MSNMGYCRFQNTLTDLQACRRVLDGDGEISSVEEREAAFRLVALCMYITDVVRGDELRGDLSQETITKYLDECCTEAAKR